MKKNLSKFGLGLLAISLSTSVFAQQPENVTNKLENPSFEYGASNWQVSVIPDGDLHIEAWGPTNKDQKRRPSFFGFHDKCLQVWRATSKDNPNFVRDNGFKQTLTDLPNGTYVFGLYAVVADQAATLPNLSNIYGVSGVNLIANENATAMATENAEADTLHDIAHARKFNVAANVQDGKLTVGVETQEATVNFLCVDECTLYYFGDMTEEDALVAMAKIDLQETLNIADTCMNGKWALNVDSLELLQMAYEDAKPFVDATYETSEFELEEQWTEVRNRIMWANKSIGDYKGLNAALLDSDTLLMVEEDWMALAKEEGVVAQLNDSIAQCRKIMTDQVADRPVVVAHRNGLREAMAAVRVYELMNDVEAVLQQFLDTAGFSTDKDEAGRYSLLQKKRLTDLQEEIQMSYDAYTNKEMTARELIQFTPQIQETIDQIVKAGKLEFNKFPLILSGKKDGFPYDPNENNVEWKQITWESKLFMFTSEVHKLRFTVTGTNKGDMNNNHYYWTMAEMELFDKNGKKFDINPDNYEALVTANASEPTEGPLVNLFDGNLDNFYHTQWSGGAPNEDHYIEFMLPEGDYDYTGFSFKFTTRNQNTVIMPVQFEITSETSQAMNDLKAAVDNAPRVYQGTEPGYYNVDMTAFRNALANANSLIRNGATDAEALAAIAELEKASEGLDVSQVNLPEPGKQYRIITSEPGFFKHQNKVMAMVSHADTALWWEASNAAEEKQLFSFERIPNDSVLLYRIKNDATQTYMIYGEGNKVLLSKEPTEADCDTVLLELTGNNQFSFYFTKNKYEGAFHNGDHNLGVPTENPGYYGVGSKCGQSSGVCYWAGDVPDQGSSWFIREMQELPLTALVNANKASNLYHMYEGLPQITFSTKEACDFENFKIFNAIGEELPCTLIRVANTLTAKLEAPVESFSFSFDHSADVEVTISDVAPAALELQKVYDQAVALNPIEGGGVYQYGDLSAYRNALADAEKILEEGADEATTQAAIAAIHTAVEALVPNLPDPNKQYFILTGWDEFAKNHINTVAMYYNPELGYPAWTFLEKNNPAYLWSFEEVKPAEGEEPTGKYFIKNVASANYLTDGETVTVGTEALSGYRLTQLEGDIIAFDGDKGRIHGAEHWSGHGTFGQLVYWGAGLGSSSTWRICEAEEVITDIDFSEIAPEEETTVKGVYDLFGRRVVAPTKGLYIIDGKKRIIK